MKQRLDVLLVERGMAESREKAKAIIKKYEYVLYSCAQLLMEKEKIGNEEFTALFHTENNEGSDREIVQNSEV